MPLELSRVHFLWCQEVCVPNLQDPAITPDEKALSKYVENSLFDHLDVSFLITHVLVSFPIAKLL